MPATSADGDEKLFEIVRFYKYENKPAEVISRDNTEAEAQAHCKNPATKGPGWFDWFREQED